MVKTLSIYSTIIFPVYRKSCWMSVTEYPFPVFGLFYIINKCEINIMDIFNVLDKLTNKIATGLNLFLYPLYFIFISSVNAGLSFPSGNPHLLIQSLKLVQNC